VTVIIPQRFWMRGDTKEVLEARNEVLYEREFCCETDTGKFKIGKEGVPWNDTPYADTLFHLAASGTDTITAELPFAFELYDMAVLHVRAAGANTGAATFNGLPLTKHGGVALVAADIAGAGKDLLLAYNEAVPCWELLNPAVAGGVPDGSVTYAKLQGVAANSVLARAASTAGVVGAVALSASQLLGRGATGDIAPIALGAGLAMSGATLNVTAAGADIRDIWLFG
jgi:hypothetical protein